MLLTMITEVTMIIEDIIKTNIIKQIKKLILNIHSKGFVIIYFINIKRK
jgi:hypothetical protein